MPLNSMKEMIGGCCVCSDERGWDENPLVYCDGQGCTVAVHQACYGIVTVPTGPWYCRKCESKEQSSTLVCELCPNKDGALKRTDTNGWAHVVCALYIPEVRFGNVTSMEPIILAHIPTERFSKVCYICEDQGNQVKSTQGACMQCNKLGCKHNFHVTCAQALGLLCEEAGNYVDNVKYCGYCQYHYSKLRKNGNVKPIPPYKPVQVQCSVADKCLEKDYVNFHLQSCAKKKGKIGNVSVTMCNSKSVSNTFNVVPGSTSNSKSHEFVNPDEVQKENEVASCTIIKSPVLCVKTKSDVDADASCAQKFTTTYFAESNITKRDNIPSVENTNKTDASTDQIKKAVKKNSSRTPGSISASTTSPPKQDVNDIDSNSIFQSKFTKNGQSGFGLLQPDIPESSNVTSASKNASFPRLNDLAQSQLFPKERNDRQKKDDSENNKKKRSHVGERKSKRPRNGKKEDTINGTNEFKIPQKNTLEREAPKTLPTFHVDATVMKKTKKQNAVNTGSGCDNNDTQLNSPFKMNQSITENSEVHACNSAKETLNPNKLLFANGSMRSGVQEPKALYGPPLSGKSSKGLKTESSQPFPHRLEQLLERQWEQGSQFLMEQAQHFDIASLLSCLYQLRQENSRLEEHINGLIQRRDHLLAVNARLSVPLAVHNANSMKSSSSQSQRVDISQNRMRGSFPPVDSDGQDIFTEQVASHPLPMVLPPSNPNLVTKHPVACTSVTQSAMRPPLTPMTSPDLLYSKSSTPNLRTGANNYSPIYQVVSPPVIHPMNNISSQILRRETSEEARSSVADKR